MKFEKYKRLESVRIIVDEMLKKMDDTNERRCAYLHLYGVSQAATILALKRGLDPEIAAITGMLHDYYSYATGIRELHGQNTAEMLRPTLRNMDIFTKEEQEIIRSAIFHHSDKGSIHSEYDELMKDADVLQHYLYNVDKKVSFQNTTRLKKILHELSLPDDFDSNTIKKNNQCTPLDKQKLLGDIAEAYAKEDIVGIGADHNFQKICKFWPGVNIYKEFMNSWCAAFVYLCVQEAGFLLPIRYPNGVGRFTGVDAWLEWSKFSEIDFFHDVNEPNFIPQRGDLVIYDKLIIDHLHDHIGVVLTCENDSIVVAEGNVDNKNKSGIVKRNRWNKVSGYIRISNNYKYNFTGEYKVPLT